MHANYDASSATLYVVTPHSLEDTLVALEATLTSIPNLGKPKPSIPPLTTQYSDLRVQSAWLNQNQIAIIFAPAMPQTLYEAMVNYTAINALSATLVDSLRMQYGCFYNAEFSNWSDEGNIDFRSLTIQSIPEDSKVALDGLVDFYNDIDAHIDDGVIASILQQDRETFSRPERFDAGIYELMKALHENQGVLVDNEEIFKSNR